LVFLVGRQGLEPIGSLDLELSEKRGGVVRHLLEGQRAIDSPPLPLDS